MNTKIKNFLQISMKNCIESSYKSHDIGLIRGQAGLFLCLNKLTKIYKSDTLLEQEILVLYHMLTCGNKNETLDNGLAGLCMAIQFSSFKKILNNYVWGMHSILIEKCNLLIKTKKYDYFDGATGLLYYLLLFSNDGIPLLLQDYCNSICNDLESNTFHSYINYENKKVFGLNLGTAHGITGCLLVLLAAWEQGYKDIVFSTIHKLSDILLNNRLYDMVIYQFPSFISENNQKYGSDITWCYGDLMTWYSIWKMAYLDNDDNLANTAIKQLINITKRSDFRKDNIILCHGLSSLFIVYRHLYKKTRIAEFAEFSNRMQQLTIKLFNTYCLQSESNSMYRRILENPSFFVGISGCVLSLIVNEEDDSWTKILLL